MSDNQVLSSASRQSVLSTAMRFDGADVQAAGAAGTYVYLDMPANVIVLRVMLSTITVNGGASATYNVGLAAGGDEDLFGANFPATVLGDNAAGTAGVGIGLLQTEAFELHVSEGTGTVDADGDHVLIVEYIQLGRTTEVYGDDT